MNINDIYNKIENEKLMAIVRKNTIDEIVDLCLFLEESGVKVMEVPFTILNAHEAIKTLSSKLSSDTLLGAGTIINKKDAKLAIKSGAKFLVSPVFDKSVAKVAKRYKTPIISGVSTPKDVHEALKANIKVLKLFPANQFSFSMIKDLKGPFPNIEIIPTGGMNLENFKNWLQNGAFAVGVASDITKGSKEEIKVKLDDYFAAIKLVKNR